MEKIALSLSVSNAPYFKVISILIDPIEHLPHPYTFITFDPEKHSQALG
jgi:hypothetical protein